MILDIIAGAIVIGVAWGTYKFVKYAVSDCD